MPTTNEKTPILSAGQEELLDKLLPIAEFALSGEKASLPMAPRTHTLLCAPSGTGKSHLMKHIAGILNVPLLHLNCSIWTPLNTKEDQYTWNSITSFIEANPKGIIVLDEIDKISSTTNDWLSFIRLEIHDLLDGVVPHAARVANYNLVDYDDYEDDDDQDDLW